MIDKRKTKRSRGRPKGSEINDDVALNAIAEFHLKHPAIKPATAVKRVSQSADESYLHRLNRKYRERAPQLRVAVEARIRLEQAEAAKRVAASAFEAIQRTVSSPGAKSLFDVLGRVTAGPAVLASLDQLSRANDEWSVLKQAQTASGFLRTFGSESLISREYLATQSTAAADAQKAIGGNDPHRFSVTRQLTEIEQDMIHAAQPHIDHLGTHTARLASQYFPKIK